MDYSEDGRSRDGMLGDAWWRGLASVAGVALAIILIAVVIMVGESTRRRDAAIALERHSYDVLMLVRGIDGGIGRAEAALGRFVISGDKVAGTIYYNEWVAAGRQLARLQQTTLGDPVQRGQVTELLKLYQRRGNELTQPAGHANYKQYFLALATFNDAGKAPTVGALARALEAIASNERTLLVERAEESQLAAGEANFLAGTLSVLGIVVVLLALTLGWLTIAASADFRRARETADEEADRAGWLEVAVAERTAELSATNLQLQREMADREAAEMQLRQVQKMEAVGQLTGGIAHDFNNMLAVVVGGLDLARRRLQQEADEVGRHIDNAMEGATRAAALTRRLLTFSRAEPLLPQTVDPGRLIEEMSDLLDRTLGERITVQTRGLDGLWRVWVDGHQLENAILNLAVNARDAMDGEGRLLVTARNMTLADGEVGEARAGDYVCIAVVDDGCGMASDVAERVFEPFFTTKPVGKGTGLGLSQIFGFVRQSGGEIALDSVQGTGTIVSLYLPRYSGVAMVEPLRTAAEEELVEAVAAPEAEPAILVVEDDPRVLRATMDGLHELGYAALSCASGEEALALLDDSPSIRLLISDVVMPNMTGPDLVRRALARWPDLGILYVTGYVGDAGDAEDLGGRDILRKPFTLGALGRVVAAALPPLSGSSLAGSAAAAE